MPWPSRSRKRSTASAIFDMFVVLSAEHESAPRLRIVSSDADDALTNDLFEVPAFLSRA